MISVPISRPIRSTSFCGRIGLYVLLVATPCAGQDLRAAFESQLQGLLPPQGAALLWDIPRNTLIAAVKIERFSSPQCLGSIIKPFLILAWLRDHRDEWEKKLAGPSFNACVGRATLECPVNCWNKNGHGRLELREALALSCNQYFFQLASETSVESYLQTLARFDLLQNFPLTDRNGRQLNVSNKTMVGLDPELQLVPIKVLQAYVAVLQEAGLVRRLAGLFRGDEYVATKAIVGGLRLSAIRGTSVLAQEQLPDSQHLLGKTGTSPAFSRGRHRGDRTDGWFAGFFPAEQPAVAVMICYPDGLGARDAAPLGGKVLRAYLETGR